MGQFRIHLEKFRGSVRLPLKRQTQNYIFSGGFTTTLRLKCKYLQNDTPEKKAFKLLNVFYTLSNFVHFDPYTGKRLKCERFLYFLPKFAHKRLKLRLQIWRVVRMADIKLHLRRVAMHLCLFLLCIFIVCVTSVCRCLTTPALSTLSYLHLPFRTYSRINDDDDDKSAETSAELYVGISAKKRIFQLEKNAKIIY